MWFGITSLVFLIVSLTLIDKRIKRLELGIKELQWKLESVGHSTVQS